MSEDSVLNLLGADQPGQMAMEIVPTIHHHVAKIKFGQTVVDILNEEVETISRNRSSNKDTQLVGQLRQHKDSAQLDFDLTTPVGVQLHSVLNSVATTYLNQGYGKNSYADCYTCWTNHAYAGDYNPLHEHTTNTAAGLSGFMWLKMPEEMEERRLNKANHRVDFGDADGQYDGWTHMCWGLGSKTDLYNLKLGSEEYVQPEVGTLYIFPKWLHHQVLPFSGAGERRSIAMNWDIIQSEQELKSIMSPYEYDSFISNIPDNHDKSIPLALNVGGSYVKVKLDEQS